MRRFLFATAILCSLSAIGCGGSSDEQVYVPETLSEPMSVESEVAADDPRDEPPAKPSM